MRCLFGWQVGWHGKKCRTVFLTVFMEEKWAKKGCEICVTRKVDLPLHPQMRNMAG